MSRLECRACGPLEMTLDGAPPPAKLLWKKHAALLIYLSRSSSHARTREHIVGMLWPENDEEKARHSLRQAVRLIRQCCGNEAIVAAGERIELAPGLLSMDVDNLDDIERRSAWDELLRMRRGEFLEGFSVPGAAEFDLWLEGERRVLRVKCLGLMIRAAEERLDQGSLDSAQHFANRALTIDPASDAAVQILIRATALLGQRGTALAVFDRFRATLDELGIQPSESTLGLLERVRRETKWTRATQGKSDREIASERPPLVGRSAEMSRLASAWRHAISGPVASAVLLEGDPGTGKTRLAEEFLARIRLEGAATGSMRVVSADTNHPWSGVVALARSELRDAPGVTATDPGAIATLCAVSDEWADAYPRITPDPAGDLRSALRHLLNAVTEEQPAALVFDGAERLDGESLSSINYVLRELKNRPLLVLLNTLPGREAPELDELQARTGRDIPGETISVTSLDESSVRSLADWAVGSFTDEQRERLVRRVIADSAGLPLLVVEMLQAVAAGLEIRSEDTAWPQPDRTLDQTMPADLPGNVVGAVRVRFGCLSPDARKLLALASVLPAPVAEETFTKVSDLDPRRVVESLDELEWARWLTSDPRGYSFVARIIRQIIADDMVTAGMKRRILDAAE